MPERDGTRIAGRVPAGCIGALIVPAGPAWLVGSAGDEREQEANEAAERARENLECADKVDPEVR